MSVQKKGGILFKAPLIYIYIYIYHVACKGFPDFFSLSLSLYIYIYISLPIKWRNLQTIGLPRCFYTISYDRRIFRICDTVDRFLCSFKREGAISILNSCPLKLVDKFTYLDSSMSSTESDVNLHQAKAWIAIDWLSIIWKSNLSEKIKRDFFQAAVESILLYVCTTWPLTKLFFKKARGELLKNTMRYNEQILKETTHETAVRSLTISKTIQLRRIKHVEHCWRNKD